MYKQSVLAALISLASAHQNWHQFWVNGVSPGYQTCLRMPPSNSPVTNVTSNDITCNVNGNIVPSGVQTCGANAGDTIEVQWDSSTHPGPITHFLYGPVADAASATGLGTWYKIDEFDYQGTEWANEVMEAQNMTYSFKLPSNLASGDYLLRGEMEALHASETLDGAQFYIGCAQLKITGSASGGCAPGIQLPGDYQATDSDIYISNFYNGFEMSTFTAPGGPVATCGGSGGASAPKPTTSAASEPVATSSKPAVTSSKAAPPATTAKPTSSTKAPVTSTTLATKTTKAAGASSASGTSTGAAAAYGQCGGGSDYTGPTTCVAGYKCVESSQYYSQCVAA